MLSRIFPFLVLNMVDLLFYTSFYWKWPASCHVLVKWTVVVGEKQLARTGLSYSLWHIGHTQSQTSNGFLKLVVVFLYRLILAFFHTVSNYVLTVISSYCLAALSAMIFAFNSNQ